MLLECLKFLGALCLGLNLGCASFFKKQINSPCACSASSATAEIRVEQHFRQLCAMLVRAKSSQTSTLAWPTGHSTDIHGFTSAEVSE
jgi:hypothetical protein